MRSRTGLASLVENQACGIAKYPRLRVHRREARMTPAKRRSDDLRIASEAKETIIRHFVTFRRLLYPGLAGWLRDLRYRLKSPWPPSCMNKGRLSSWRHAN